MPRLRLTATSIRSLEPKSTDRIYWDAALPGFGLKVTPKGHKTYVVQYRNSYGVDRRMTLCDYRVLTVEQARTKAKEILAKVVLGRDPAKEKAEDRNCITIDDIIKIYMDEHISKKGMNTQRAYRGVFKNWVSPFMGKKPWKDVDQDDCQALLDHVTEQTGEGNANNAIAYLRSAWNRLIPKHLPVGSNPTIGVELHEKKTREVVLCEKEYKALYGAITSHRDTTNNNPSIYYALEMLILTGARKMEVLTMRWDAISDGTITVIDKGNSQRRKPKTKQLDITEPVQSLLDRMPKHSDWLFPRTHDGREHITATDEVWQAVRTAAGLPYVTIHDLRRSFISFAIHDLGLGLETVSKAVGHGSTAVTQAYYNKLAKAKKSATNEAIASGIASKLVG
jgi:integrase